MTHTRLAGNASRKELADGIQNVAIACAPRLRPTHVGLSQYVGANERYPVVCGVDIPPEVKISIHFAEEQRSQCEIAVEVWAGWLAWHKDSICLPARRSMITADLLSHCAMRKGADR